MRGLFLLALAGCCVVPTLAAPEFITVATYNVENYVAANRMVDGSYRQEYPKPENQKKALRQVIRAMNADVLLLQEMGGGAYLEELRRDLRQEGMDYPHFELLEADDKERHVAALSRLPFKAVDKPTDLSFRYFEGKERVKRGVLQVRIAHGTGEIAIFAMHLKSRFTERVDDPNGALRRAGEAVAVRDYVLREFPEPAKERLLLVGDFNDVKGSRPLRAVAERGRTRIAELLPAFDSRGQSWTHWYRKEDTYSRVDHIFVSAALKLAVEGGAATIYDGPETTEASDHRPVWVRLRLE